MGRRRHRTKGCVRGRACALYACPRGFKAPVKGMTLEMRARARVYIRPERVFSRHYKRRDELRGAAVGGFKSAIYVAPYKGGIKTPRVFVFSRRFPESRATRKRCGAASSAQDGGEKSPMRKTVRGGLSRVLYNDARAGTLGCPHNGRISRARERFRWPVPI